MPVLPQELRAFRESLGLTRQEFAPKLFISTPTLERWERGQGGPREFHLRILRRMQEFLSAGQSIAYFQYDAAEDTLNQTREAKATVVESLKSLGLSLYEEKTSEDNESWWLHFGLSWASADSVQISLLCEGSCRAERPSIDFTMRVILDSGSLQGITENILQICFDHAIVPNVSRRRSKVELSLRQRMFDSACNPQTIQHILGNYRSCWNRLEKEIVGSTSVRLQSSADTPETSTVGRFGKA